LDGFAHIYNPISISHNILDKILLGSKNRLVRMGGTCSKPLSYGRGYKENTIKVQDKEMIAKLPINNIICSKNYKGGIKI
jgi:hypothetical protein